MKQSLRYRLRTTIISWPMLASVCVGLFLLMWNAVYYWIMYCVSYEAIPLSSTFGIFLDEIYKANSLGGFGLFSVILAVLPASTLFCDDYNSGYHVFTPLFPNTSTRVILKKPKTDSSIRKVWLPKTLAYILREWKKAQDELRSFLGDEYQNFDLVVALPNGRPCEDRIILKEFEKLREKAGLPRVVFHSLRHSSTTYKLKLNHGDLKATQAMRRST